jgi:outer membrane protein
MVLCLVGLCASLTTQAQELDSLQPPVVLTLKEVIDMAKMQSPAYFQAKNAQENQYWKWRTYKSNYLPQLLLEGALPYYTKAYNQIPQPDGTIQVPLQNFSNSNLNLSLSQNVGLTGGQFFVDTRLERYDNFLNNSLGPKRLYNSLPGRIGYRQPIFRFNQLSWDKKIEPLKYEESHKQYAEELENMAVNATTLFFNLLLAQNNLEVALKNQANNDTIYKIGQGRYNLGKVAENELLQLELGLMTASQEVSQGRLDVETSTLRLKIYIGLTGNQRVQLLPPTTIPEHKLDEATAIAEARKNRQSVVGFKRRVLEAERDVAQAKGDNGLNGDLIATYGVSGTSSYLSDTYVNTVPQQMVQVTFQIPILDWGRSRSIKKTAYANYERVKNIVSQDELNFDQEVYTQVKQFEMLREQLKVTRKSEEIAQKRYDISKNRYMIGKIGITDLYIALTDKDKAKVSYVQSLRNFWNSYYSVRKLTLYDFETNSTIYRPGDSQ